MDGILYTGSVWQNWNDNRNVPYLYSNDSRRNLNLNWFENDWNSNDRLLRPRNSLLLLNYLWGVCFFSVL